MPTSVEEMLSGVQEPLRSIALRLIEASGGRITIVSGFRDHEHQTRLWNQALDKYGDPEVADNWVARPGTSNHEHGTAIDFGGDMELLAQLAPQFGLLQPMDNEPWHWELGDGASYEGEPTLGFEMGETEDPTDALANKLNAIFSILGGNNGGYVGPMDQQDIWGEVDRQMSEEMGIDVEGLFESGVGNLGEMASGALGGAGQIAGGSVGQYQKYALKQLVQRYGLPDSELPALIELWNRESNWNPNADNPTSSAAGIAQKMTSIHGPVEASWQGQIDWGLDYIIGRYGTPSAALQWHNRNNWY